MKWLIILHLQEFVVVHSQVIHYYLVDDTIEVREVHQPNDGRDPFPVLVCRQKLPKNRRDIPGVCACVCVCICVCVPRTCPMYIP